MILTVFTSWLRTYSDSTHLLSFHPVYSYHFFPCPRKSWLTTIFFKHVTQIPKISSGKSSLSHGYKMLVLSNKVKFTCLVHLLVQENLTLPHQISSNYFCNSLAGLHSCPHRVLPDYPCWTS